MKEQPFYIGQKVVFVDAMKGTDFGHDLLKIKKGQICVVVDIVYDDSYIGRGPKDWYVEVDRDLGYWILHSNFAPVEEGFQAITFEKVMEQELTSVN